MIDAFKIFVGGVQRGFGCNLSQSGRAKAGHAEFEGCIQYRFIFSDDRSDTDTAFAVTLRHGIEKNGVLFDSFQIHY